MPGREVTAETVERLTRLGGFTVAPGQVEKRAVQLARLAAEAESLRRLDLGVTAPATPWVEPTEE